VQRNLDFESVDTSAGKVPLTGNEFASLGFLFSSPITPPDGQLYVEPPPVGPSPIFTDSNYLSIGIQPYGGPNITEDDLTVDIIGNYLAFAIRFIDNTGTLGSPGQSESITVYGDSGIIYVHPNIPFDFFGIRTDQPIRRIVIDELPDDNDDVGFDDLALGADVPEPGTFAFAACALVILGWLRFSS
jgi:hypothetical protein